jgi:HAD superfamily phosphatase (TIGR01668 family)
MRELTSGESTPDFVPDFMATSVADVDFKALKKRGVRFVALDADSTLVRYRGVKLNVDTRKHLLQQKKYIEAWCIASNRITNTLSPLSSSLDAHVIPSTFFVRKPKQRYFQRVIDFFSAEPHEIAMVGDKLLADVWGANRAGMVSVWVEHFGKDGLHDRALGVRSWEKLLMRKYGNNLKR